MSNFVRDLKGKKILVVGDIMLDHYLFGKVDRISPEAPVPVAKFTEERHVLGGAANVAANIAALGGVPHLIGVLGNDEPGTVVSSLLKSHGINASLVIDGTRMTTRKTRIVARNQQLLRLDYEDTAPIPTMQCKELCAFVSRFAAECELVAVSDYAKGVVSKELMEAVIKSGKKAVIDPKPKHKALYQNAFLVTPNTSEAAAMAHMEMEGEKDWNPVAEHISRELGSNVLLTLGASGMMLFPIGGKSRHFPSAAREVYDVSGAGDTVVAAVSLGISSGASLEDACWLANMAAGVKVGKFGTAPVSAAELEEVLYAEQNRRA